MKHSTSRPASNGNALDLRDHQCRQSAHRFHELVCDDAWGDVLSTPAYTTTLYPTTTAPMRSGGTLDRLVRAGYDVRLLTCDPAR